MKRFCRSILSILLVLLAATAALAADDPRVLTLEAMQAELERSMERIELPGFDGPYFISYLLRDVQSVAVEAAYGALLGSHGGRNRRGYVEVRVGDYSFDNSGKGGFEFSMGPEMDYETYLDYLDAPIDDGKALRRMLWRVTDLRYKGALSAYQQKKSRQIFEIDPKVQVDDFTREQPARHVDPVPKIDLQGLRQPWEKILAQESAYLASVPGLIDFDLMFHARRQTRIYVNSEGGRLITESVLLSVSGRASLRADDGMLLLGTLSEYGRDPATFIDQRALHTKLTQLVDDLKALSQAEVIDPYTGPAILGPEVAGVFFHEAVGHRLEGERQRNEDEGQTFANKVGEQVIPTFLSVIDDPTLASFDGTQLNGHYLYDDEGVKAWRVELIDHGVLRNYLLSRAPVEGFDKSNGHGRSASYEDPMARMANTIVLSDNRLSDEQLKQRLMELTREAGKPYGLIIRGSVGGHTSTSTWNYQAFSHRPLQIYKVDAQTGEETLVRGAEIVGTPLTSINKIVATGSRDGVFNGFCGAESGYVPVSAVAPAILVSELELQKVADVPQRPPILPPPGD
ncbi:MAG: metallopeptidase TldD-related protein [Candidatus Alcyoniella australis]|nr:metallopeptidase TldD-related protein [Candidatus Alcyoniella australis]